MPGVLGAVAVTIPGRTGSRDRLAAAVQLATDTSPDQLRAQLVKALPAHMVPQHIEVLDRIPYSVGGKVDRTAVCRTLAERGDAGTGHRPPAGPVQSALAAIVADVLGVPLVGVDDDFFARGGDSVLATTLVARIRQRLDVTAISVADIFATRTVEALARRLSELEPADRLEAIAELYLEVALMDTAEVTFALTRRSDD
jgi:mycobactin phenyloxazoline synthetase